MASSEATWVELINERTKHLMKEVAPTKLLPYLNLSNSDKESIRCDERNSGKTEATVTLLDKLKKQNGPNGRKVFDEFVRALRNVGSQQSALLLDPHFKVPSASEDIQDKNSYRLGILGTAAAIPEIGVRIRLLNEETKKYCVKGERDILSKYEDIRSDSTLQLRDQLHKDLPEGAAFSAVCQETKDNLPACKLRVSLKSAADQIWEDYNNGKLEAILKKNLLSGMTAISSHLRMRIDIMKEEYERACRILAGGNQTDSADETQKFKKDGIPPVFLDKRVDPELKLRSYQHELSWPALEGKNSIICAPANSGKAFVALGIAKTHLEKQKKLVSKCSKEVSHPKVLFVVNKVNLVLQQRQRFDYYLSNSYDITDISGDNAQEKLLDEIIQENDVIVLTAQILVDALKSRRVAINDFSLLIFDECHHTDTGHPYNDIMLKYLEIKFPSRVGWHPEAVKERLPQIIGLTASLGVRKARNKNEAQDHILQLCANLDCSVIVTVEKYKKDLNGETGRCKRICHEIPDGEADYFDEIVQNVMITIEGMMPQQPAGRNGRPQINHGSQQYQQWLKELERSSVALNSRDQFTLVQHLMVYNTALSIKKSCRVKDALKYVTEFHEKQSENKFKDIDRKLRLLYEKAKQDLDSERRKKGELKNPKLEAVAQLLKTKYQACVEEGGQQTAKGMLFTQTRENAKALKAWLDENSDLAFIRAELLVGTGKGEDGMTQCQQEEVIASFRSGRVNLLVSTTVADEGIDTPDCKYVIRYDVRGNEIASVQSRGLVRDKAGQYEVVAGKETGIIEKENLNVIREEMMEDAIREVKAMDEDQYKRKV